MYPLAPLSQPPAPAVYPTAMSTPKPNMRIVTIVGARPQFIKAAMLSREISRRVDAGTPPTVEELTIHTGQHFDENMSAIFFDQLNIPEPSHHLGIGGGSHGQMTGQMIEAIERILMDVRPDWVLVYGDTNSMIAGALAAVKLLIPVAHVEAGLRTNNKFSPFPEEINRRLVGRLADIHFPPTKHAKAALLSEGVDPDTIFVTGNTVIDALLLTRKRVINRIPREARPLVEIVRDKKVILITGHRRESHGEGFENICAAIRNVADAHSEAVFIWSARG